ncbi:MAG: PLDc N-terminal domain-containing protein [Planctomycetota bacterium]|nr:PLDc N-terminal domain-containing protein [Planctomycetota bacterium]
MEAGIGILVMGFIGLVVLGVFIFWIWMLVDCATNEPSEGNEKIIWILIIIFTHPIGALIYLLVRRPQRISQFGR